MLFLVVTNISVLLSRFLESKTEILLKTKNNIVLVYFVMIRLLVILFIIKLYAQKNIFKSTIYNWKQGQVMTQKLNI